MDYSAYSWLIIAAVLVAVEIATGTFYLLMLAIAALITWVADKMGASFLTQTTLFLIASVALSFLLHRYRKRADLSSTTNAANDLDAGELITVTDWSNGIGVTQYRGAAWQVVLQDKYDTAVNGTYQIVRFEGNRSVVKSVYNS